MYLEGKTVTLTAGNNDSYLTLAKGTYQRIKRVRLSVPGGIGDITIRFYNGTVGAGTAITGTIYLASQPAEGFDLTGLNTTGTLGWRIAGWTEGNSSAFINVTYTWG